jgi:hypothetical protein
VSRSVRPRIPPRRMQRAARSSVVLTAALVALVPAGCFGGSGGTTGSTASGPTRAQFVAQARQICAGYQKQIAGLKGATTLDQLAVQGRRAIALQAAELKALRGLAPPPADRAAVKRMLDGLDQSIATARSLVAAADGGDTAKVSAAATALQTQLADTTRLAKPFGLALCAS